MPQVPALRLRHTHDLPVSLPELGAGGPFTLEAWVCPALMDGAARLFAQPGYDGPPVRLRPGAVASLPLDSLPQLGSVDLPDGVEAVFFAETDFKGASWAVRDDTPTVPPEHATARSVVVVDRRHRRQDCVVLFSERDFRGQARLLRVGQSNEVPDGGAFFRSAWLPPGVALEQSKPYFTGAEPVVVLRGDQSALSDNGYRRLTARRETCVEGTRLQTQRGDLPPEAVGWSLWMRDTPLVDHFRLPADTALLASLDYDLKGPFALFAHDQSNAVPAMGFNPGSLALLEAPDGLEGVFALGAPFARAGRIFPAGTHDFAAYGERLIVPVGYRVLVGDPAAPSEIVGAGDTLKARSGPFVVERICGVLTRGGAVGLMLRRTSGRLRSGGDALDFAGAPVRIDQWSHVAVTWDGTNLRHFLNGREVKGASQPLDPRHFAGEWRLGAGLRGSLAQVRAWPEVRDAKVLSQQRYPGVTLTGSPVEVLGEGAHTLEAPPDAVAVMAELPTAPEDTTLMASMRSTVNAEHQERMREAEAKASAATTRAQERASERLALARDEARRHVHFAGIQAVAFVRGDGVVRATWDAEASTFTPSNLMVGTQRRLPTDTAWAMGEATTADQEWLYISTSWPEHAILRRLANGTEEVVVQGLASPPMALAVDGRGLLDTVVTDGTADPVVFWIEDDGTLSAAPVSGAGAGVSRGLVDKLPAGRPRSWDLAIDASEGRRRLVWSNGWEIFCATYTTGGTVGEVRVLVPHAASPFPVAVSVDPDGTVIWVDVEEGWVRSLAAGDDAVVRDLYRAAEPARALVFGLIQDKIAEGGDPEAHFVYWSAKEEKTWEVPVLDTPGRYIDLKHDPNKPFGQQVSTVAVDHAVGARWDGVALARPIDAHHHIELGPFDTASGLLIRARMKLEGDNAQNRILVAFGGDRGWINPPRIYQDGALFWDTRFNAEKIAGVPFNQWYDLEIELSDNRYNYFMRVDGVVVARFFNPVGSYSETSYALGPRTSIRLPFSYRDTYAASALILSVEVTDLSEPRTSLAAWTLAGSTGAVRESSSARVVLSEADAVGLPSLQHLKLDAPEDAVVFEPVRIDMRQGWTVSAVLSWSGPGDDGASQVLYELCTDEDEDRFVAAIDASGKPYLRIRWAGQLVPWTTLEEAGTRITPNFLTHVTWALSPSGELSTWIDGERVSRSQLRLRPEPRVFSGHRLGAPNPAQLHTQVRGALLHDQDALTRYTGVQGTIQRFAAWNQYAPQAARGFDEAPGPDPSWSRSLVSTRTRRRYLHAGRVDGSEPPLALFPIDLDCGLALETRLSAAHARLSAAHAQVVAAQALSDAMRAAAVQAAEAAVSAASAELKAAQDKAAADLAAAQADASRQRAAAARSKDAAAVTNQGDKSAGAGRAQGTRSDGERQASGQEVAAASDKRQKVGAAQQKLETHRRQHQGKQDELNRKR